MQKLIIALCLISTVIFTGCFDTIEETTINIDGSGSLVTTIDMSSILKMAKMAGGDKTDEMGNETMDTVIHLSEYADSMTALTDIEKKLMSSGTMRTIFNPKDEELKMVYSFLYSNTEELGTLNELMKKVLNKGQSSVMDKLMKSGDEGKALMGDSDMSMPDLDDYFTYSFTNGKISKKLDKEKYAGVSDNKALSSMREIGQMGLSMSMKVVYNLPEAAKKTEGKGVKLSGDKKTITVETSLDDFFDEPALLEYQIEY